MLGNSHAQEYTRVEKRIVKHYIKEDYEKAYDLSKKQIDKYSKSKVVRYCYAISNYQLNKKNIKSYELDRTLRYLKFANVINPKESMKTLIRRDSLLLLEIRDVSKQLAESDFYKRKRKAIKRFETLIVLFEDTADFYMAYLDQLKTKEEIQDKILINDNDQVAFEIEYNNTMLDYEAATYLLKSSINNFSQKLEELTGIDIYPNQEKMLDVAGKEFGVEQYKNDKSNPEILKYFQASGCGKVRSDETNWCAAFMNYCAMQNGLDYPKSLVARNWLNKGVKVNDPTPGDIIVLWRGKKNGWQGHVAFYMGKDENTGVVYCYGGNQDGKVCVRPYPEEQVLAYRRLN